MNSLRKRLASFAKGLLIFSIGGVLMIVLGGAIKTGISMILNGEALAFGTVLVLLALASGSLFAWMYLDEGV